MTRLTLPVLFLMLVPSLAAGTTVVKIDLATMTHASHVIVHGEVVSVTPVAVGGNERHIRTDVVIRVLDLLKGPRGLRTLTLQLPGGKLGAWAMQIPGMPGFIAGEEVVLFLENTRANYALTGLSQGKFSVRTDPDGVKRVKRHLDGIHFVAWDKKGRFGPAVFPREDPSQTLKGLIAEVRTVLSPGAVRPLRPAK